MNKVAIWGTGKRGKEFFMQCQKETVLCFVDSVPKNGGLYGKRVISPSELYKEEYDLLVVTPENNDVIRKKIYELKVDKDKVVFLFVNNFDDWEVWDTHFDLLCFFVNKKWVDDIRRRQGLLDKKYTLKDINVKRIIKRLNNAEIISNEVEWSAEYKGNIIFKGKRKQCVEKIYDSLIKERIK